MMAELEAAWRELDADPRRAGHRQHRRGQGVPDRARRRAVEPRPDALREQSRRTKRSELRFTAWHNEVWKPVIAAVNGTVRRRRPALRGRRRHRHRRGDATFLDPHVSVGQVTAYEAIGLARKMPFEPVMRMALVGRHERMSAQRAYELGMVSQVVDPPERLRDEAQALAEKIAKNSPAAMRATKQALWGALEAGLTDACRAGAGAGVDVGPPRPGRRPAFAEKRGRSGHLRADDSAPPRDR